MIQNQRVNHQVDPFGPSTLTPTPPPPSPVGPRFRASGYTDVYAESPGAYGGFMPLYLPAVRKGDLVVVSLLQYGPAGAVLTLDAPTQGVYGSSQLGWQPADCNPGTGWTQVANQSGQGLQSSNQSWGPLNLQVYTHEVLSASESYQPLPGPFNTTAVTNVSTFAGSAVAFSHVSEIVSSVVFSGFSQPQTTPPAGEPDPDDLFLDIMVCNADGTLYTDEPSGTVGSSNAGNFVNENQNMWLAVPLTSTPGVFDSGLGTDSNGNYGLGPNFRFEGIYLEEPVAGAAAMRNYAEMGQGTIAAYGAQLPLAYVNTNFMFVGPSATNQTRVLTFYNFPGPYNFVSCGVQLR